MDKADKLSAIFLTRKKHGWEQAKNRLFPEVYCLCRIVTAVGIEGVHPVAGQQAVGGGGPVVADGQLAVGADVDVEGCTVLVGQLLDTRAILDGIVIIIVQGAMEFIDAVLYLGNLRLSQDRRA